jgi:nucleotide-binding universal stress UspA family protein
MTSKKPDTIASLAKAIAKEAQAAAPGLAEAADKALDEKTAAHEVFCRLEAAWGDARHAKNQNERRAEAAAVLARLADRPDLINLIDLLVDAGTPPGDEISTLMRRGLVSASKNGARVTSYHWSNLGYRVSDLARELRDRLAAPE